MNIWSLSSLLLLTESVCRWVSRGCWDNRSRVCGVVLTLLDDISNSFTFSVYRFSSISLSVSNSRQQLFIFKLSSLSSSLCSVLSSFNFSKNSFL